MPEGHEIRLVEGKIPDRETTLGRAWRVDPRGFNPGRKPDSSVATWFVEAKWAHPWWSNYLLVAVHLRPTAGLPDPVVRLEDATHEVLLYALNPDKAPDFSSPASTRLEGPNFVGQWIAAGDIDAERKVERCVEEILAGTLSPDTDCRRQWVERFSASNLPGYEESGGRP